MELLFFDETAKVMALPDEAMPLGYSKEVLLKKQEQENAALFICSCQLGLNHIHGNCGFDSS